MHTLWQDLRYGLRGLAHRPAFAVLAVLTLALGIGAATTVFSVIQNVLLDPFPYTDAARVAMIQIHDSSSSRPGGRSAFQVQEFLDISNRTTSSTRRSAEALRTSSRKPFLTPCD